MANRPSNDPASYRDMSDSARKTQMGLAWAAYYGRFTKPLKRTRGMDDNVIINRCRPVVDVGVDFLFGQDVGFELEPGSPAGAQDYLDSALKANRMMTFLQKLAINGGVTGQPMIKIIPEVPYPRLVVLDPTIVSVETAPDDMDKVLSYTVQYPVTNEQGEEVQRRQLIRRMDPTPDMPQGSWLILDQQQAAAGVATWSNIAPPVVWPWSFPPIADNQNLPAPNQYWGEADLGPDLIQTNNDLNFLMSNTARIIRFHAHPKTWGRGFNVDQMKIGVDGIVALPGENSVLQNLEMTSDLHSSLNYIEVLRAAMDELSRVPSIAVGNIKDVPKGQISGVALNILYKPLLQKTELKRRLYGDLLIEVCRRILEMGGFGPDCAVTVHWPPILQGDPMADAQTALLWRQLGVSQATTLDKIGFDPALEAQKCDAEGNIPAPASHPIQPSPQYVLADDPEQTQPDALSAAHNIPPMSSVMNTARPNS